MVDWYSAVFSPKSTTIEYGFSQKTAHSTNLATWKLIISPKSKAKQPVFTVIKDKCLIGTDYLNQQKPVVFEAGWSPYNRTYM